MHTQVLKFISIVGLTTLLSCGGKPVTRTFDLGGENREMNTYTLVRDSIKPNNFFCRIDSATQYGYGWLGEISSEFKNKKVEATISGAYRVTHGSEGGVVLSVENGSGETKFWTCVSASKYANSPNQWFNFMERITVNTEATNSSPLRISIYLFKPSGKGFLDLDNLRMELKAI